MVMPSPMEEHLGEIWNPKDAKSKISDANRIVYEFIEDVHRGRAPKSDLNQIADATDILGLYAGYPTEASNMEGYIKSELAFSYQEVAVILEGFAAKMNRLIDMRLRSLPFEKTKDQPEIKLDQGSNDAPF